MALHTLQFSADAGSGKYQATYTSGESNVLQYRLGDTDPRQPAVISIQARIGAGFGWCNVKTITSAPRELVIDLPIPAGVEVLVTSSVPVAEAGVLQS